MTPAVWAETVMAPPLEWKSGGVLEPFTPFEVTGTIRLSPQQNEPDLIWPGSKEYQLSPGPGGLFAIDVEQRKEAARKGMLSGSANEARSAFVPFGAYGPIPPIRIRALRSRHDSAGWPPGITRPPGPWSDETLSVLGDQFLERGLKVGHCFLKSERPDPTWMPVFPPVAKFTWRRSVIDTASFDASTKFEFGRSLALQAITASVRHLELYFRVANDFGELVRGLIAGGGLPCLEKLSFKPRMDARLSTVNAPNVESLRSIPGFNEAFPLLNQFEIPR